MMVLPAIRRLLRRSLAGPTGLEWFRRRFKPARRKVTDPGPNPGSSTMAGELVPWRRSEGLEVSSWQEWVMCKLFEESA